jgi:hypothetical protein
MRVLLYIVSILVPLAGIIIGIILLLKDDQESKHVGKICLIIGIVVGLLLTVLLAAVLYIATLGFVPDGGSTPTMNMLSRTPMDNGFKFVLSSPTSTVHWSELTIILDDGVNTVHWDKFTTNDLTTPSAPAAYTEAYPRYLGDLDVYFSITDLAGNGEINNGDFFTLEVPDGQSFGTGTTYTLTLIHEPSNGQMLTYHFQS